MTHILKKAGSACVLLVALLLLLGTPATSEAQCAMCRRALQSPEGQHMIAAFRSGILFLLAAPFSVFGAITVLAVRRQRRRLKP